MKNNENNKVPQFDESKQILFAFGNEEEKKVKNKRFKNNMISTTKYNVITWAPKSLLLQFQRVANIYFLLISILTCLDFSPKNPITMIGTFAFVLFFTMLKEGYEDIKRYRQDKEINTKFEKVYNKEEKKFENRLWQDLKVGDLVKIHKEEAFAADLLVVQSSEKNGMCSIDTMQLDGETNLKEKYVPAQFKSKTIEDLCNLEGDIICDYPSAELEKWDCCVLIENSNTSIFAELKNLILKGCILKNTEWIVGIITYTGHDTKIMKNAKPPPVKTSNVMNLMNKLLYSVFVVQILICVFFSVGAKYWLDKYGVNIWYIPYDSLEVNFGIRILIFLVSYSHLIPISLYVSLEVVKMVQAKLISYDVKMEDYYMNNRPAMARTSDLIEELGQVEFIFSDKTGTLTKNEMIFQKCTINNHIYGEPDNKESTNNNANYKTSRSYYSEKKEKNTMNTGSNNLELPNALKYSINGDIKAANLLLNNLVPSNESVNSGNSSITNRENNKNQIYNFFTVCSVCHSAYVDKDKTTGEETFISSSPDEVALLEGAKKMGFVFKAKSTNSIEIIDIFGKHKIYTIKLELPFDSTRKRMSLIVENNNHYILLTKGADNEMLAKVNQKSMNPNYMNKIREHLDQFAREGLRTLVMAQKELTKEEVDKYIARHGKLQMYTGNDKEQKILDFFNEIESDFEYIGSSAIEDKLQDGVSDTIDILMKSGIKIWVLTGDKKETAIEIGKSCKLLQKDMLLIDLTSSSPMNINNQKDFTKAIEQCRNKYMGVDENSIFRQRIFIIIDGKNLSYVFSSKETSEDFFNFALIAHSVICCRVSPKYKANVVRLAKENGTWITLAIGDGANDVPMIMEAHIGIGVSGKEGTQAIRSADYAIGQFQFLKRLILLHGRWGYIRISVFICYYFYKNIVLVCTEIYFAAFNGFSGQLFFPDFLPTCYNCIWTSWPCVIAYAIEQDVNEENSFKYPILYQAGQKKIYFNLKVFWLWIFYAIIHGVITYFVVNFICFCGVLNETGITNDHWTYSTLCFTCLINDVTFKTFLDLTHWNLFAILIGLLSLIFYYICLCCLCTFTFAKIFQVELVSKFWVIMTNYKTVMVFLLLPFFTIMFDVTIKIIQKNFFPTPADIIQLGKLKEEDTKSKIDESGQPSKIIYIIYYSTIITLFKEKYD